jgi:transposase-like protein
MARRPQAELHALQDKAFSLLADGAIVNEAALALGVSPRTVRRWRQQKREGPAKAKRAPKAKALAEMLRVEGPAVARVMLDLAKGGDVRAAALVVKLLGNTLTTSEEGDDGDNDSALCDIERELASLPPVIASEIVGLLAEAEAEAANESGGKSAASGRRGRRPQRLPWQAEGHPSDEGADPL